MTPPTFYKEIASGRLRTFKVGRSRKIAETAEADWIAQAETEAAGAVSSQAA